MISPLFRFVIGGSLIALVLPSSSTSAQSMGKRTNIVMQGNSTTIEILGLRQWTIAMLNDSLRKYQGHDLTTQGAHGCAVTLRHDLRFPDAAVMGMESKYGGEYWLITLVEPQDSNRVRPRRLANDTTGGRPEWAEGRRLLRENSELFGLISRDVTGEALRKSPNSSRESPAAEQEPANDSGQAPILRYQRAVRRWLVARQNRDDFGIALEILRNSPNQYDRQIALIVILPFLDDDRTWTALSQTLVESEGPIQRMGFSLFSSLLASGRRPKDMNAVLPALHAILDGASQFLMPRVMTLLLGMQLDTAHAAPLLKNGGQMLLAYAGASHRGARGPALELLATLSPRNYGRDVDRWKRWVESL